MNELYFYTIFFYFIRAIFGDLIPSYGGGGWLGCKVYSVCD